MLVAAVEYVTCDAYNAYLMRMLHMRFLTHFPVDDDGGEKWKMKIKIRSRIAGLQNTSPLHVFMREMK